MNISLIDVDGKTFPNLALMKISAFHKFRGDKVKFHDPLFDKPDKCYVSKIFSFTPDYNYFPECEIIKGGTGYNIKSKLPNKIDRMLPDYSLYNCENAYGFLTRGCIRKCSWCLVPEKEGNIKPYMDIDEILGNKKTAILMDNNILAHEHGITQIEKIINIGIPVDFNQGLDARLIDNEIAKMLSKVKWLKPLRLACDTNFMIEPIKKAITKLRWFNCRPFKYSVYVLAKDIERTMDRLIELKGMNVDLFLQPYRDYNTNIEPEKKLIDFATWVNTKPIFNTIPWETYYSNRNK